MLCHASKICAHLRHLRIKRLPAAHRAEFVQRTRAVSAWAVGLAAVAFAPVLAQDSTDPRLPQTVRLALRARAGDTIRMESGHKTITHIHLEAVASEFSTETSARSNTSFLFRGRGANGTMQFELRDTTRLTTSNTGGIAVKPVTVSEAGIFTFSPNLSVIKRVPLSAGKKATGSQPKLANTGRVSFGVIRFPDRVLKAGDTWSGSAVIAEGSALDGITLHYDATLAGIEMYQSFP